MTSSDYMAGRKKWFRPQAMLWSDTPAVIGEDGNYIPSGFEEYSDLSAIQSSNKFLILSDHNRTDISVNPNRIENKKRMVNGTMRSYHTADKVSISTSWNLLPSRSHSFRPNFYQETVSGNIAGKQKQYSTIERPEEDQPPQYFAIDQYTVDGGAGAEEIVAWYESHVGPFWVFLSYDKKHSFGSTDISYTHLAEYSQAVLMRISSIDYSIVKRSGSSHGFLGHDLWNISISLEEV